MKKITRQDVLEVVTPTDLNKTTLAELLDDSEMFVSQDGDLYVVGYIEVEGFSIFDSVISSDADIVTYLDIKRDITKFLADLHKMVQVQRFSHIAEGGFVDDDDAISFVYLLRPAKAKEKKAWLENQAEKAVREIIASETGLIKAIRDAQKAGLAVNLTSNQYRVVEQHNCKLRTKIKKESSGLLLKV